MKPLLLIIIVIISLEFLGADERIMRIGYLINDTSNGVLDNRIKEYYEELLAPSMGVKVEWIGPLPFARILVYLKNGNLDMFYAMSRTNERKDYILYSDTPSWYDNAPIVVRKEYADLIIDSNEDLYGYKIGYCLDMIMPKFSEDKRIDIQYVSGNNWGKAVLMRLVAGSFDMAFFPSMNSYNGFKKELNHNKSDELMVLDVPQEMLGKNMGKHYDGFSKITGGELLSRYESAIEEVGILQDYYFNSSSN
ncbi:MAG: transporter substrate-binding domain-containing protein [Spirochaetaceae bacterium]